MLVTLQSKRWCITVRTDYCSRSKLNPINNGVSIALVLHASSHLVANKNRLKGPSNCRNVLKTIAQIKMNCSVDIINISVLFMAEIYILPSNKLDRQYFTVGPFSCWRCFVFKRQFWNNMTSSPCSQSLCVIHRRPDRQTHVFSVWHMCVNHASKIQLSQIGLITAIRLLTGHWLADVIVGLYVLLQNSD